MLGEPHFVKRAGIDIVRVLLEQGACVNEKDFTGKTALGFTKSLSLNLRQSRIIKADIEV
jgi:hypothetical protein